MIWCGDQHEGVREFRSCGGQGPGGSAVEVSQGCHWGQSLNLYKDWPSPVCAVRGLGFFFGKIGVSEAIVLGTGLRDIRSPNQYKIIRAS